MTGKTHIAIGIAATLTLSMDQPVKNQILLIGAAALGSLIPDLDHPKAKLNQKLLLFKNSFFKTMFYLFFSGLFLYIYYIKDLRHFLFLGIGSLFISVSTHRGFTHSIIGFLSFSFLTKLITSEYNLDFLANGFIIGYLLHLLADFLTYKGIKLFYPLDINVSSPIVIKVNSSFEKLIFIVLSFYSFTLLFKTIVL